MEFLEIGTDELRIAVSPYGAALARVWLTGHPTSLVLGLPTPEDYADAPHAIGVVVGPVAGRISGAQVSLHGVPYRMEPNTPPDCLHSGSNALQHRLWSVDAHGPDSLTLSCTLEDGACGLPGLRVIRATYALSGASLTLTLETTSDADTYLNATSHAYWVLDDSGTLEAHSLQVNADRYVETGADLIPTGRALPLHGTALDFTTPRSPLSGPPLDNSFCLTSPDALRLTSARSGIRLQVDTNQPALVLYTGENMPALQAPARTPRIAPFSALAIEAQGWPDAPNHAGFPSILLPKSTTLKQMVRFNLSKSQEYRNRAATTP